MDGDSTLQNQYRVYHRRRQVSKTLGNPDLSDIALDRIDAVLPGVHQPRSQTRRNYYWKTKMINASLDRNPPRDTLVTPEQEQLQRQHLSEMTQRHLQQAQDDLQDELYTYLFDDK